MASPQRVPDRLIMHIQAVGINIRVLNIIIMYGFREFLTTNTTDEQVVRTYLENPKLPVSEIARHYDKSQAEVYRILHANDISPNRLKANHQKVHNLANLGWGIREIAQFTGYTPRNIRYILSKNMNEG